MDPFDGLRLDLAGQPLMIKIVEAARLLGIGRTLAYQLANRFQEGDRTGLPVVRIGGCLRVPRWALVEFVLHGRVDSDLQSEVTELVDEMVDGEVTERVVTAPTAAPHGSTMPAPVVPEQLALGL